jgi:hypothetical protein
MWTVRLHMFSLLVVRKSATSIEARSSRVRVFCIVLCVVHRRPWLFRHRF